jgi:hypothetical protein
LDAAYRLDKSKHFLTLPGVRDHSLKFDLPILRRNFDRVVLQDSSRSQTGGHIIGKLLVGEWHQIQSSGFHRKRRVSPQGQSDKAGQGDTTHNHGASS